jgi:hypothetical protein
MEPGLIRNRLSVIGGVLLLAITISSGAHGAWFSEMRVTHSPRNSHLAHGNGRPVAAGPDGRVHLVWSDDRDRDDEIYYSSFDGMGWTANQRLTYASGGSAGACVAVGTDNRIHIAWHDYRDGDYEIYYRVGNGVTWGPEERLTQAEELSANPSLGVDGASHVYVVWNDTRDGNREIYHKAYDGTGWGEDQRLTSDPADSYYPMIAVSPAGHVHVVWRDNRDGNKEIYYKRFDGSAWSEDIRLTCDPAISQEASICLDTEGNQHVVWSDNRDGNKEIYYKHFDGVTWQPDVRLTFAEEASTMPCIAADDSNHLHVTWIDYREGGAEVFCKSRRGTVWGEDRKLTGTAGGCSRPSICSDKTCNLHVIWQVDRHGDQGVYWKERYNGFTEAPVLSSITPAMGNTDEIVTARLTGSGFFYPDSVWLARQASDRLVASDVVTQSDSLLTCNLLLDDAEIGLWDVVVKNSDGKKDTLVNAFEVLPGLVWADDYRLTYDGAPSFAGESRSIAVDPAGNLHVVWQDMRDGRREIYYKRREGARWGLDERLTDSDGAMRCPCVTADEAGNILVVWQATQVGGYEIYYKRFDGIEWGEATRLNRDPGFSLYPDMTTDDSGRVHVVWSDNYGGDLEILYRMWDGTSWSKKTRLTDAPGASLYPSIDAGEDGCLNLVWQDDRDGVYQVYYKMFDGVSWGADERVTQTSTPAIQPSIATGPDGGVHVAWNDFRLTGSVYSEIYYRSKGPAGWSASQQISGTYFQAGRPSVAADALGTVHVVWQFKGTDYYRESGIAWARGSSKTWRREVITPRETDLAMLPSVETDRDGVVHLVYCDDRFGEPEIYYRSWSREPAAPPLIGSIVPAEVYNSFPVRVAIYGTGFLAAPTVWLDNESGDTVIAEHVERKSQRLIECEFQLVAVSPGLWDLHVENADRQGDELGNGVMVLQGPWSLPEQISCGPDSAGTGFNNARCVAREPNGVAHAVWSDNRDGNFEIYYRRQGLSGVWGTEIRLTECEGTSGSPSIVWGPPNAMHLCWNDHRSGTIEVYYKEFYGTCWGADQRISPDDSVRSENPSMALDAAGNPFIFYHDKRYGPWQVMCARWDGTEWIEERITNQEEAAYNASCASDFAGCVHVFWESKTGGGREIYHRVWTGSSWEEAEIIAAFWANSPTCTCDYLGRIMVVWSESYYSKLRGAIRYDGEWHELAGIPGSGISPNLAADGIGHFHLVYEHDRVIYYQVYGDSWSAPVRMNRGSHGSEPFVASDAHGHPIMIWTAGKDDGTRVMGRRWEGDPAVTGLDTDPCDPAPFGIACITPNPFRADAQIRFGMPSDSKVSLAVFDVRGRLVWEKNLTDVKPGLHSAVWNGEDRFGRKVSSGVYFVHLVSGDKTSRAKVVLLR